MEYFPLFDPVQSALSIVMGVNFLKGSHLHDHIRPVSCFPGNEPQTMFRVCLKSGAKKETI